jgi:hypothetical protein
VEQLQNLNSATAYRMIEDAALEAGRSKRWPMPSTRPASKPLTGKTARRAALHFDAQLPAVLVQENRRAIRGGAQHPIITAVAATNGTETHLYGAATDDVASVTITLTDGRTRTAAPADNVFAGDLDGAVKSVSYVARDGSTREVIKG